VLVGSIFSIFAIVRAALPRVRSSFCQQRMSDALRTNDNATKSAASSRRGARSVMSLLVNAGRLGRA